MNDDDDEQDGQGEFDFEASAKARDEAVERVERNNAEWVEEALRALEVVALCVPYLTSEDVWKAAVHKPREGRAMGAVMTKGKKEKWIAPTPDFKPSKLVNCHAAPTRIWKSLIYRGPHESVQR